LLTPLAGGQITPAEAAGLTNVVATYLRSIETTEAVSLLDEVNRQLEPHRKHLDTVDVRNDGEGSDRN
jgi:hypothetical protein